MSTTILDGQAVSKRLLGKLKTHAEAFAQMVGRKPGLAVIHAGSDPASVVYVRNKEKACLSTGIDFKLINLPEDVSFQTILESIDEQNERESCDGLIVQLPLPSSEMNEKEVIRRVSVLKDVDGFHPETVGNLWSGSGDIAPCTPAGILELLKAYDIDMKGRHAVVVGRSNIVGKPIAALLLREHATVTIAHSRTSDLASVCREADILIAAVGKPGLITRGFFRTGTVIIDVGINRITPDQALPEWLDPATDIGSRLARKGMALVGDVDPLASHGHASFYTPVPGGIGPMTVAMLIKNTLTLAARRAGIDGK